ncbi:putative inorganic phosphate transporter [Cladophialophora carrionii]|uniref:Putative inorganic phosphate transporter n=1 Tax=Cladophialophora carrionii TaxID=86049 RepID=A0A1C1CEX1_9EURO|nr:putative inorganic phosphate transporter [Cladophialophora carrionii]
MLETTSQFGFFKFLVVAGVGLFGDGYLNLSIGLVVPMLGYLYFADEENKIPTLPADTIKAALSIGMIVGQLGFASAEQCEDAKVIAVGILGDALGRHRIYGKELMITILGTLLCVLMPWRGFSHHDVIAWMSVFRVLTGIGIGGDYPMTSALSAEHNPLHSRAKLVLAVFASIGLGGFTAGITYLILLAAFKSSVNHDIYHLHWVWRLLFALGLVPLIITLYFRLTMPESKPYQQYVAEETSLKKDGRRGLHEQFRDFKTYFSEWKHAKVLFAVSMCWFLFDIAFYGVNLNQSVILSRIGYGKADTPWGTLWNTAVGNIIVAAAGYLPGYYIGIFLPDWIGRVRQQFYCSAVVAGLYAIWAGVLTDSSTSTGGLIAIFTLAQLFLNMGPNCTTFLLPVEVFPTRVRGTAHGIAAASGKAGAIVTAFSFAQLTDAIGLSAVLGILAGIMALCAACTLLIPETKGRTLDEIEHGILYGESRSPGVSSDSDGESYKTKLGLDARAGAGAGDGVRSGDGGDGNASPVLDGRTSVRPKWDVDADKGRGLGV